MYLTDEQTEKLKSVQMEMLDEFKRICDKNGLKYWLDSGTLLGAVRHKGFIPWDDDIDVGMLREDYDKFAKIASQELDPDKYYYQNWLSDKDYGQPFAKIRKKNTTLIESSAEKASFFSGIYIDIFAYDEYGDKQFSQGLPIKIIRRMILCKCGYKFWEKENGISVSKYLIYLPIRLFSAFFSTGFLKKRYEKIARRYNGSGKEYVFENGTTNYNKWVVKKDCFDDTEELEFEGKFYKCPGKYAEYLEMIYGDYMKLPPKEKQVKKHPVVKFECE
ncbi:MAG: LicD family protein [Clostridia bacterium]|nr:LicD family protein [Clostridia bacterium]